MLNAIDTWLQSFFTDVPLAASVGLMFVVGTFVGGFLAWWISVLTPDEMQLAPGEVPQPAIPLRRCLLPVIGSLMDGQRSGRWIVVVQLGTGVLYAVVVLATIHFGWLNVHEVRPPAAMFYWRLLYHLIFVSLLIAATGTDLRDYVIPDEITMTGLLIGVGGAALAGHFQIMHLWVDWNHELPLEGPYIPEWIKQHEHWHGLAWSCAGAVAGGGIMWLVRMLSSLILGREALGFGDVTLMAMIGAFLGWQPVVFVFLLAPLWGIVIGLLALVITQRPYVPYGPFLCAAALTVLLTWGLLWEPTRAIFGHGPSLGLLAGVALGTLVGLLGLMRLYRMIPVKRRTPPDDPIPPAS